MENAGGRARVLHLPPRDQEAVLAEFQRVDLLRSGSLSEVSRLVNELSTLEDEFISGELSVRSGPRRGQPLTEQGRRRRVDRLTSVACDLDRALRGDLQLSRRAEELWRARTR